MNEGGVEGKEQADDQADDHVLRVVLEGGESGVDGEEDNCHEAQRYPKSNKPKCPVGQRKGEIEDHESAAVGGQGATDRGKGEPSLTHVLTADALAEVVHLGGI